MIYYKFSVFCKISRGYSLIELSIALLIMMIMIVGVFPDWQYLRANNAANQAVAQTEQLLHTAREQAILRSCPISVCSSDNSQHCIAGWSNKYIMFINQDGKFQQPPFSASIILAGSLQDKEGKWRMQTFTTTNLLTFQTDGTTWQNSSFIYCPNNHNPRFARAIYLSQTGRVRISSDSNGDGIHEDSQGQPLTCPASLG